MKQAKLKPVPTWKRRSLEQLKRSLRTATDVGNQQSAAFYSKCIEMKEVRG